MHDLRVLVPPPRLGDLALLRGDLGECPFVEVERQPVAPVADGVRLHLDSGAQCGRQHRLERRGIGGDEAAGVRIVRVGLQQRRAAAAQRAIHNDLDHPHGQFPVELVDAGPLLDEPGGVGRGAGDGLVDPDLDAAVAVQPAHALHLGPAPVGILDLRPAELGAALCAKNDLLVAFVLGRRRHEPAHQPLRGIHEHAGGLPLRVLVDRAARRSRRRPRDPGQAERRAVGDRRVPVGTRQEHRIVGRDLVEILPGREHRRAPEGLDPPAPGDPLPRAGRIDPSLHPREKLGQRVGALEIEGHLPAADAAEMHVGIREPGDHRGTAEVDDARVRTDEPPKPAVVAHIDDLVALDRDGLHPGLPRIRGVDLPVPESEVGRLGLGGGKGEPAGGQRRGDDRDSCHPH